MKSWSCRKDASGGGAHLPVLLVVLRRRGLRLEHLEHAVGDEEAADDVDRAEDDRDDEHDLVERAGRSLSPSTRRPPSTTIPWIAFVPDISGVCSVFGTFEMTAKPTKPASTRIARLVTRHQACLLRRGLDCGLGARVDDLAVARDARAGDDLVVEVELDRRCRAVLAVLDDQARAAPARCARTAARRARACAPAGSAARRS